jgi:hypothetical protein
MEVGYVKCRPSVEKSLDVANTSVRATRAINSSATMPLSWIGRAMHARGWHRYHRPWDLLVQGITPGLHRAPLRLPRLIGRLSKRCSVR